MTEPRIRFQWIDYDGSLVRVYQSPAAAVAGIAWQAPAALVIAGSIHSSDHPARR